MWPRRLAQGADDPLLEKNGVQRVEPGKVVVKGDVAMLYVIAGGKDAVPGFIFHRESIGWRLDLVRTTQASNAALELAAKKQGVSEREFMIVLMEFALEREVGSEVWVAPKSAAAPE